MKFNFLLFAAMFFGAISLSTTSCSSNDDETFITEEPDSVYVKVGYRLDKDFKVDGTVISQDETFTFSTLKVSYIQALGDTVTVVLDSLPWIKELDMKKPFDAYINVQYVKNEDFVEDVTKGYKAYINGTILYSKKSGGFKSKEEQIIGMTISKGKMNQFFESYVFTKGIPFIHNMRPLQNGLGMRSRP